MDPQGDLDDCPDQNHLGRINNLCREETPYNWEGGYREARGGGGRWGGGEAREEQPLCGGQIAQAGGPFVYIRFHNYSARFNNRQTSPFLGRGEVHRSDGGDGHVYT
jgi:hypothetical protein